MTILYEIHYKQLKVSVTSLTKRGVILIGRSSNFVFTIIIFTQLSLINYIYIYDHIGVPQFKL